MVTAKWLFRGPRLLTLTCSDGNYVLGIGLATLGGSEEFDLRCGCGRTEALPT